MEPLAFALAFAVIILVLEGIPWLLFRGKMKGIQFPHELDTSFFRFFTFGRVRILALGHTIFLLLVIVPSFLFLW